MLLVIDVGNTQIVIGVFDGKQLIRDWRLHTNSAVTADELHLTISQLLAQETIESRMIGRAVISCVVPPLINALASYCRRYLNLQPLWVTPGTVDIVILYDKPDEVGADRLVNAVAAYHKYRTSLIVIDFGTATTFDIISGKGEYIGGAISPGIGISAEALFSRASKLPRVEFQAPPKVIGTNTSESMRSGLMYGYAELVDGMVSRIRHQMAPACPRVIATGGMAPVIGNLSQTIEAVEAALTLEGLRIISEQAG
ncbi:MAG: type III pantothenate kinase [Desulfosalsimonadaceae bacterium]